MKNLTKSSNKLKFALLAFALVIVLTLTFVMSGAVYAVSALDADATPNSTTYTSDYASRADVLEAGKKLSREIAGEGYVMLKNDNNALPLKAGSRITVLGKNSENPVYTGNGSGSGHSSAPRTTLYTALEQTGFKLNPVMTAFYANTTLSGARRSYSGVNAVGMIARTPGIAGFETPISNYGFAQIKSFDEYNDLALVVITRYSGEGFDLPRSSWASAGTGNIVSPGVGGNIGVNDYGAARATWNADTNKFEGTPVVGRTDGSQHYLQLDDNENDLINLAKKSGFKRIAVVLNSADPVEIGDLIDDDGIDAAIWAAGPGNSGFLGLGDILNGSVNPSGHLPDTFLRDFRQNPTFNNFSTGDNMLSQAELNAQRLIRTNADAEGVIPAGYYDLGTGNAFIVEGLNATNRSFGLKTTSNTEATSAGNYYYTYREVGDNVYDTYSYNRYVKYKEGVYMGYRYHETMYEVLESATPGSGDAWYDSTVLFPFGYGLSYTDFEWETVSSNINFAAPKSYSTISVKVTNTGSVAGKDVVQLYSTPPYVYGTTAEKPVRSMIDFAKTKLLQPGESTVVSLKFQAYDLASWYSDIAHDGVEGAYRIDAGEYKFLLQTDSHNMKAGIAPITYTATEQVITEDPSTGTLLQNQFEDAMEIVNGTTFNVLTRNDMAAGHAAVMAGVLAHDTAAVRKINKAQLQQLYDVAYLNNVVQRDGINLDLIDSGYYAIGKTMTELKDSTSADGMWYYQGPSYTDYSANGNGNGTRTDNWPTYGANHTTGSGANVRKLGFRDLIGVDRDTTSGADLYQRVVENMTLSELATLVNSGSHRTQAVATIGMPLGYHEDGPCGFNTQWDSQLFPVGIVIAAMFNVELAEQMGELIGELALWERISAWYGPATNMHRSEFSGRNFEYYSEDVILSAKTVSAQIRGASNKGLITDLKHFALNEQETDRGRSNDAVCTYADEQTIREIYLKPFEHAVKTGGSVGIMGAFGRIGDQKWASAHVGLNTNVLRGEWGFRGLVITDASSGAYMYSDNFLRGGTDFDLGSHTSTGVSNAGAITNTNTLTATTVFLFQQAAKNIIYANVNSNLINYAGVYNSETGVYSTPVGVLGYTVDGVRHYTNKTYSQSGNTGTGTSGRTNYASLDLSPTPAEPEYAATLAEIMAAIEALQADMTALRTEDIASINTAIAALDVEGIVDAIEALNLGDILTAIENLDIEAIKETLEDLDLSKVIKALEDIDLSVVVNAIEALDLDGIKSKIDAIDIAGVKTAIAGLDIDGVKTAIAGLDIAGIKTAITETKSKIDALGGDITAEIALLDLDGILEAIEALELLDVDDITAKLDGLKTKLDTLQNTDLSGVNESLEDINGKLDNTSAEGCGSMLSLGVGTSAILVMLLATFVVLSIRRKTKEREE